MKSTIGEMGKRLMLTAVLVLPLAWGAEAAEDKRMPVTPQTTQQKAKFVNNLVTQSAASRTIEDSGDETAKQALTRARGLVQAAIKEAEGSGYKQADEKLNQAVDLVMTHSRRLSEGSVKSDRARQIYETRLASVNALLEAYERIAEEKKAAGQARERRASIQQTLREADALATGGRIDNAVLMVEKAYNSVSVEVAKLRDGDKLTKTLKFDNAKDEYVYEVDRNDSHFYLLTLTLAEKQPGDLVPIEAIRKEARAMRQQAEGLAEKHKHADAIRLLGASTDKLIRALRMAGAYIPG